MPEIIHEFSIRAPQEAVFQMFATPVGLEKWWTKESDGEPRVGAAYRL